MKRTASVDYSFLPGYDCFTDDRVIVLVQKFWANIIKRDNECWDWMGAHHNTLGRGSDVGDSSTFILMGTRSARKVAYLLVNKSPVPKGLHMLNPSCDNYLCCNPIHYYLAVEHNPNRDSDGRFKRKTV